MLSTPNQWTNAVRSLEYEIDDKVTKAKLLSLKADIEREIAFKRDSTPDMAHALLLIHTYVGMHDLRHGNINLETAQLTYPWINLQGVAI